MKALAFGEVLWDIFGTHKYPGGAPLNVAVHLSRLGFDSAIFSAVGMDPNGMELVDVIASEGVGTGYIAQVNEYDTGETRVQLQHGIPDYVFNEPCAWDDITMSTEKLEQLLAEKWDVFCFGTLAQRSVSSRRTLERVLSRIQTRIHFFDVNLRKEFYSRSILESSLEHTDILKMNNEECPIIADLFFPDICSENTPENILRLLLCRKLTKMFDLEGVLVTCGKDGTEAYFREQRYVVRPADVPVIDTVGAGDSFSAGFLASYAIGQKIQTALETGSLLADYVVSHNGAFPEYELFLQADLQRRLKL